VLTFVPGMEVGVWGQQDFLGSSSSSSYHSKPNSQFFNMLGCVVTLCSYILKGVAMAPRSYACTKGKVEQHCPGHQRDHI